jgi:two-component system phosphate regulon response regulator PhoB
MHTLLIVDDHPEIRHLLDIVLQRSCTIIQADNGVTALELIKKHHPTVVLLDVMMYGGLNGLQVLDAIKADPETRTIKVAIVSARGQAADTIDAAKRGADHYFVKPFSPMEVVHWVKRQLV